MIEIEEQAALVEAARALQLADPLGQRPHLLRDYSELGTLIGRAELTG